MEYMARYTYLLQFLMKKKLKLPRIVFYADTGFSDKALSELASLVDNSTTTVTIPTPKGWECERKSCNILWKHGHNTYPSLNEK